MDQPWLYIYHLPLEPPFPPPILCLYITQGTQPDTLWWHWFFLNIWCNTAIKKYGPGFFFVINFYIASSISLGLSRFSLSSWISFGRLYVSKNLCISSRLPNLLKCIYSYYPIIIPFTSVKWEVMSLLQFPILVVFSLFLFINLFVDFSIWFYWLLYLWIPHFSYFCSSLYLLPSSCFEFSFLHFFQLLMIYNWFTIGIKVGIWCRTKFRSFFFEDYFCCILQVLLSGVFVSFLSSSF